MEPVETVALADALVKAGATTDKAQATRWARDIITYLEADGFYVQQESAGE